MVDSPWSKTLVRLGSCCRFRCVRVVGSSRVVVEWKAERKGEKESSTWNATNRRRALALKCSHYGVLLNESLPTIRLDKQS